MPDEQIVTIRFRDDFRPAFKAGNYLLEVKQELYGETFSDTKKIIATGTRFVLEPGDIHSVFPPPNSSGLYGTVLPHVVFTKPMLPWERNLHDFPDSPWLVLLVFREEELLADDTAASTRAFTTTVESFLNEQDDQILIPNIKIQDVEEHLLKQQCQVITMPVEVFRKIRPSMEETKFLAHGRTVSTEYKEILTMPEDGTFSLVVSNRFAVAPQTSQTGENVTNGTKNIVHLVSIEGLEMYLNNPDEIEKSAVRMVSLASWSFNCLTQPLENFESLLRNLAAECGSPTMPLLRLPVDNLTTDTPPLITARLTEGCVPIEYHTHSGEDTFAWYRGPFVPQAVAPWNRIDPNCPPAEGTPCESTRYEKTCETFATASAAMIYDKENGLFDQSYAAAWQVGRSLALADQTFAVCLHKLRRRGQRSLDQMHAFDQSRFYGVDVQVKRQPDFVAQAELDETPDQRSKWWVEDRLRSAMGSQYAVPAMHGVLSGNIPPSFLEGRGGEERVTALQAVDEQENAVDGLRRLIADADHRKAIRDDLGVEIENLAPWLGKLLLLYGVPLHYLVPDWRMLPVESMRFFYVDPNWLDCLIDGALSIGAQSSRDIELNCVIKGEVAFRSEYAALKVRSLLRKKSAEDIYYTGNQWGGFLIRSALVSGWPGIEIQAFDAQGDEVKLLRMERLLPDLMLCLFDRLPDRILFNEPQEGTFFGTNEDGQIVVRRTANGTIGQKLNEEFQADQHMRAEAGVLNVAALQAALVVELKDKFSSESGHWGPAEFALQMFRQAQQFEFKLC